MTCGADCGSCSTSEFWWQAAGGHGYAGNSQGFAVTSKVPTSGCTAPSCVAALLIQNLTNDALSDGFLITGGGSLSVTTDITYRQPDIYVIGSPITRYTETYDFFYRRTNLGLNPTSDFTGQTSDIREPTTQKEVYYHQGNLTLQTPWVVDANEKDVIFVDGNLTITDPSDAGQLTTVAEGGFLAFIVSGDIIIDDNVGNADGSQTPNLEGFFLADGSLTIQSDGGGGTDKRFVGEGTYVAWDGVELERDLGGSSGGGGGSSSGDQTTGGTATANNHDGVNIPASSFDNSNGTYWASTNNSVPAWLEYEFSTAKTIKYYSLYTWSNNAPRDFQLQYYDGATWQTADTRSNQTNWQQTDNAHVYEVSGTNSSTRWRLYITANNGGTLHSLVEFQMFELPPSLDLTLGGTVSATSEQGWATDDMAFNNDPSTHWISADDTLPQWLEYNFGSTKTITSYTITYFSGGTSGPVDWQLQYYDGATWQTADTQTGISAAAGETKSFTVASPQSASRWRIYVTANFGSWTTISEMELLGYPGAVVGGGAASAATNGDTPAELFIFRPDFVRYVPDILKYPHSIWQETN